jgi:bacillithiol system protein YtxJ
MNTQTLESPARADTLIDSDQPTWIFKESNTCPISKNAFEGVRGYMLDHPDETVGHVVVQEHRQVSDHIAERLGIKHHTPQIILVHNGRALWSASHFKITAKAMVDGKAEALNGGN